MKFRIILFVTAAAFLTWCGYLIYETGILTANNGDKGVISLSALEDAEAKEAEKDVITSGPVPKEIKDDRDFSVLRAVNDASRTVKIGSVDPESGYEFEVELTTKGAAVSSATLTNYFAREPQPHEPLVFLRPINRNNKSLYSLATGAVQIYDRQKNPLPLDLLDWKLLETGTDEQGAEFCRFEAMLMDYERKDAFRLIKTYKVRPESFTVDCDLKIENLTEASVRMWMNIQGPCGIEREGFRGDMRTITTAFYNDQQNIESSKEDMRGLKKAADKAAPAVSLREPGKDFLWAAVTNKYFAGILRPVPTGEKSYPDWIRPTAGRYYPSLVPEDENGELSFDMKIHQLELTPAGSDSAAKQFKFELYLGPKDRDIFQANETYKKLGYYHTIHFLGCCCPQTIINPMAFAIMGFMKWLHAFIPNYGIVIMILVALVRLALHPLMKKSQVSMMKMQKLGPKMEEIKKKYANNKQEMNKHVMQLYREQGVSPFMGFIPMFLQLPILIALYSAIYASIELRGAAFLPIWITDLSLPDALVRFEAFSLPLIGKIETFNLLPILLGLSMFAQQKLMPSQSAAAQTNPQMAQQQKIMMVMMPVMMLFIFYNMPSGLNLYFMSSTAAGVVEQLVIRKHIREKQEAEEAGLVNVTSKTGGKAKKKKPKPFFKNTM